MITAMHIRRRQNYHKPNSRNQRANALTTDNESFGYTVVTFTRIDSSDIRPYKQYT